MAEDTPPETEEPPNAQDPPLAPEVARWRNLFDMPVAVQLHQPLMLTDAQQEQSERNGEQWVTFPTSRGLGMPAIALRRDPEHRVDTSERGGGTPDVAACVCGLLAPDPDGSLLVLQYRTSKGAIAAVSLRPELIAYVTAIARVPEPFKLEAPDQPSRIHRP